jgi:hypothetical protein
MRKLVGLRCSGVIILGRFTAPGARYVRREANAE